MVPIVVLPSATPDADQRVDRNYGGVGGTPGDRIGKVLRGTVEKRASAGELLRRALPTEGFAGVTDNETRTAEVTVSPVEPLIEAKRLQWG